MNFRVILNRLLAVVCAMAIIVFAAVMAACYGYPASPPAMFAGLNANSVVAHSNVTGAGSKAAGRGNATFARNGHLLNVCCEPLGAAAATADEQCDKCNKMCFTGAADVVHSGYLRHSPCRCYPVAPCPHISYVRKTTPTGGGGGGGGGTKLAQNRSKDNNKKPAGYGSFKTSAAFKSAYRQTSCVSCISLLFSAAVYVFCAGHDVYGHFSKHLMVSTALLIYVNAVTEYRKRSTVDDFRSSGIYKLLILINTNGWQLVNYLELYNMLKFMDNVSKFNKNMSKPNKYFHIFTWLLPVANIAMTYDYEKDIFHQVNQPGLDLLINRKILGLKTPLKFNIFFCLIPGFLNMLCFLYLFKRNEIQISSIHPDLISLYKEKISTRDQLFKISVLIWTADFLNFLDVTMEWDFVIIHILHFLPASKGILITLSLYRPIFNKILATILCLKRKISTNEVTVNPTLQS